MDGLVERDTRRTHDWISTEIPKQQNRQSNQSFPQLSLLFL